MTTCWNPALAREVYAIEHWGEGYFDINGQGQVVVHPLREPALGTVNLPDVVQSAREEGLALPVLIRFIDSLRDRVARLTEAFARARAE